MPLLIECWETPIIDLNYTIYSDSQKKEIRIETFNIRINSRGSIVATFFNLDDLTIDYNAN